MLGNGLFLAEQKEAALSVMEADLSMRQRLGAPEHTILGVQNNLAETYRALGLNQHALRLKRDVYSRRVKLSGGEHGATLQAASNYAITLVNLQRFEEAKALLRKTMPVARRVLGESHDLTLRIRAIYAAALYEDSDATLDYLREAVTRLEDTERIARRVLGGANPLTREIEKSLRNARAALRARETPPQNAVDASS
jgi:tetratricopeptide (TPR) repeat protein